MAELESKKCCKINIVVVASKLLQACKSGDLSTVAELTSNWIDLDLIQVKDTSGLTPLHLACKNGHLDIAHYLIRQQNCNPETITSDGCTPLHLACANGHLRIAVVLIADFNCDPQCTDNNGCTPLHAACESGCMDLVQRLITKYHCDPQKFINLDGFTSLHFACASGHLDTVKFLVLDCKCNPQCSTSNGITPLHLACLKGHLEIAKYLITEQKYNPEDYAINAGCTLLHLAAENGHLAIVKYFISKLGCNPEIADKNGFTPLHSACLKGHLDIVKFFLSDCKCNPQCSTTDGITPLHFACQNGHLHIAKYLTINQSCSPECADYNGRTPLHMGATNGHLHIVKYLICVLKCSPLHATKLGNTALHLACQLGKHNIVEWFFTAHIKCNTEQMNGSGHTPLLLAAINGHIRIVRYLTGEIRCDPQSADGYGNSPLHHACMNGHTEIAEYLINEQQCNPNCASNDGCTPMYYACLQGHLDLVKLLVNEYGCNPETLASNTIPRGRSPFENDVFSKIIHEKCSSRIGRATLLHAACETGHLNIIDYLISECGCDPNYRDSLGVTSLGYATMFKHLDVVKYLITECKCDLKFGKVYIELYTELLLNKKYLHQFNILCDQIRDFLESYNHTELSVTPIFVAAYAGNVKFMKFLISECKLSPGSDCGPFEGMTPLHVACAFGHPNVVRYLVEYGCNPQCVTRHCRVTPLDFACACGRLGSIKYLVAQGPLTADQESVPDQESENGQINIVEYLITKCELDPHISNDDGLTPLHLACWGGSSIAENVDSSSSTIFTKLWDTFSPIREFRTCSIDITESRKNMDSNLQQSDIIRQNDRNLDIVKYLITIHNCDAQHRDKYGRSPFHLSCASGNLEIVQYLFNERLCDPLQTTKAGDTPLHLACMFQSVEVVKFLLSSGICDPFCKNGMRKTPLEIAESPEIRGMLRKIEDCKSNYPFDSYIKVFVLGNPSVGKSTLVKALQNNPTFLSSLIGQFRSVKGVSKQTAGIDLKFTCTTAFGNVILYDFAGQREYYTSHAAFLQSFMPHKTGIFVVVVNISDHNKAFEEDLQYWLTFIQESWTHSKTKPCVILVGSHSDQVREGIDKKSSVLKEIACSSQNSLECIGVTCLNCTEYVSAGLNQLRSYLEAGCTALRVRMNSSVVDHRCYLLLDHLQTTCTPVGLRIKDICTSLQGNLLLPSCPNDLLCLLQTLHDKAQIILLTNEQEPKDSWVITRIEVMFKEVVGTVFAPCDFPRYSALSGSTGVVAKSKLIQVFPDLDVDMITGFLEHFEFCCRVEQDWTTELQSSTAWYRFPNLVTEDRPDNLFIESSAISYRSGWGLYSSEWQFFTRRLLHVLLLRFAFGFAKPQDSAALVTNRRFECLTERQGCTMWKSGIMWCDTNGVTTVFEVKDLKKVVLIMTCTRECETHCVKLRTQLIRAILKAKEEFCRHVCTEEYIIDVATDKHLQAVELHSVRHLSQKISTRCADDQPDLMLVNSDGTPGKRISDLLHFEPYALLTPDLIQELFTKNNAKCTLSDRVITDLASRIYPSNDTLVEVLNPDRTILSERCKKVAENLDENSKEVLRCKSILEAWKEHHGPTAMYRKLRKELDKYSIFCGRPPIILVSLHAVTKINCNAFCYVHTLDCHVFILSS